MAGLDVGAESRLDRFCVKALSDRFGVFPEDGDGGRGKTRTTHTLTSRMADSMV
jgi:hypothetical protein